MTSPKSDDPRPAAASGDRQVRGKRRYEKPRLIDYGLVSKLTQTQGITTADNKTKFRVCL